MKKLFLSGLCLLAGLTLAAYEVIVFGDVHFDSDAVRDPAVKRPAYQEKEKKRNLENWEKNIPSLMDRAAGKVGKETAFVVQLGDIVQGDCGSKELHEKSLNTVLPMFQQRFTNVRFFVTPGNHDIRGTGASAAYRGVMGPYLSQSLNEKLAEKGAIQYAFMQDKDLFVALDCNKPDIKFLESALAAHPERRHLFVMTHFPIIPVSQGAPEWTLLGRPSKPELRKQLIQLLAKNNAIVLCAHIHTITLARWQNETGSITQVSFFSIAPSKQAAAKVTDRDLQKPFQRFMDSKDSKTKQQKMAVLADFLAGYKEIKDFQPGAGFGLLKSTDSDVTLELYNTAAETPTFTLKLK